MYTVLQAKREMSLHSPVTLVCGCQVRIPQCKLLKCYSCPRKVRLKVNVGTC